MVCFIEEGVLVSKGPSQHIPLKRIVFLRHFHGSLAISNYLGIIGQEEDAGLPRIAASREGNGVEVGGD